MLHRWISYGTTIHERTYSYIVYTKHTDFQFINTGFYQITDIYSNCGKLLEYSETKIAPISCKIFHGHAWFYEGKMEDILLQWSKNQRRIIKYEEVTGLLPRVVKFKGAFPPVYNGLWVNSKLREQ